MAVDNVDHRRRGAAGAELLSSGTLTGPHRSTFTYRPTMPKGNLLLPLLSTVWHKVRHEIQF